MEEREGDKVVTGKEEETPPEASSVKVEEVGTAPYDWRFPTTNQSRHCYSRYLEYHKSRGGTSKEPSVSSQGQFREKMLSLLPLLLT
ncbi:hypothetical protein Vadar_002503 [Vaccinium darrowii]|uniref:Uncharacterized protein n=1 Tax=Vaccinium darrowii TaxID=229202 RepID=A0ACB7WX81_9ERIC|nr:hypothetical protein Vadar_002503 [Vaccinium darrowii]